MYNIIRWDTDNCV